MRTKTIRLLIKIYNLAFALKFSDRKVINLERTNDILPTASGFETNVQGHFFKKTLLQIMSPSALSNLISN